MDGRANHAPEAPAPKAPHSIRSTCEEVLVRRKRRGRAVGDSKADIAAQIESPRGADRPVTRRLVCRHDVLGIAAGERSSDAQRLLRAARGEYVGVAQIRVPAEQPIRLSTLGREEALRSRSTSLLRDPVDPLRARPVGRREIDHPRVHADPQSRHAAVRNHGREMRVRSKTARRDSLARSPQR